LKRKTIKEIAKEEWLDFVGFAIPFLFDTFKTTLILLALQLFGFVLRLAESYGLRQEYASLLDKAHFWINFGAFVMLGFDLLVRLGRSLYS
jgi:hypothetical protein